MYCQSKPTPNLPTFNDITERAMKVLKLVLVLILISLQANATGYSHNMIVAQKMLKTKKVSKKVAVKNR